MWRFAMVSDVIRESKVEAEIRKYAKSRGWWVAKFVSPGLRGVPDRIFIRNGVTVFLEVKRPGEEPTLQQRKRHTDMRQYGARVYWVDSLADAMEVLNEWEL